MSEHVEKWRIETAKWLDAQEAADILRETKNDVLAEMMAHTDGSSQAERERLVRCSAAWKEHVAKIVEAEALARRLKMRMKYEDMKWNTWRTENANGRNEKARYQ